jgi:hypothetical protein
VKDVWAMYPDLVGRVTVQCMSAMYRLQALQSDAMAHLANIAQTTKLTLDSREEFVVDLSSELVEKDLQVEKAEPAHYHLGAVGGDPRQHY